MVYLLIISIALLAILITLNIKYIKNSHDSLESYAGGCACYKTLSIGTDDRQTCKMCRGFDNSYDYVCPYNCRKFGVAMCTQGKIM